MKTNVVLKKIQMSLALTESDMGRIFEKGDYTVTPEMLGGFLVESPTEEGYLKCPNRAVLAFLEGLIIDRRGPNPKKSVAGTVPDTTLDNSDVFKKLRIALDLHEEDIQILLQHSDVYLEKNDFSAIFRKKGHKHYKVCSDPVLEAFLHGVELSRG